MSKHINIQGKRFGKLITVKWLGAGTWECRCDCGNIVRRSVTRLRGPRTRSLGPRSCGCVEQDNKLNGMASARQLYLKYKYNALKRNYSFDLSEETFLQLIKQPCYYCGTLPYQQHRHKSDWGTYIYNGIDRLDNGEGYNIDNCVTCCKKCNSMKSSMNSDEFFKHIARIYDYDKTHSCARCQ